MLEPDHNFLSKLNSTNKDWPDLSDHITMQLEEIKSWLLLKNKKHDDYFLGKFLKPGYRALFYGTHHTNKIIVSTLLGKECGLDVYKIDLSVVVSQNTEETKRNLSVIFDITKNKDWILFFDEADALFSKIKSMSSSKYFNPNMQADYFLQKIQLHEGLSILAFNPINRIEETFARHFNIMIPFAPNSL
jgi:SpoVK/Ycf46/Vps4 family AAA+-type ATPase